jgi:hypothetical protein
MLKKELCAQAGIVSDTSGKQSKVRIGSQFSVIGSVISFEKK